MSERYVITFGCPDRTGIVARIATFLADNGGWIVRADYHADADTGWFFTRQEVLAESLPFGVDELRRRFEPVAAELSAGNPSRGEHWRINATADRRRMVILVSKEGHCLYDILGRVAAGELDVEISAVIGNHNVLADITRATASRSTTCPSARIPTPRRRRSPRWSASSTSTTRTRSCWPDSCRSCPNICARSGSAAR